MNSVIQNQKGKNISIALIKNQVPYLNIPLTTISAAAASLLLSLYKHFLHVAILTFHNIA